MQEHKLNLHGFLTHYMPMVAQAKAQQFPYPSAHAPATLALAKGQLEYSWDGGHDDVQRARINYFAIAAAFLVADVCVFGGTLTTARVVLTSAEVAALAVIGTKIFRTWHRGNLQHRAGDIFDPDPLAPEDGPVYQAAVLRLQERVFDRALPRMRAQR